MKLNIEKLDHHGRGIGYIDGKVVFVSDALEGEEVEIEIVKDAPKYMEAVVTKYVRKSPRRTKTKCQFYDICGGCHLRCMPYEDTILFKREKVENILKKYAGIETKVDVIKSAQKDFYRNKIELKVQDGKYGFYKQGTHDIVEIDRCLNAEDAINSLLLNIELLGVRDGDVTIKSNYNGEIIIDIHSTKLVEPEIERLREKNKLVGIVLNEKTIFGTESFIEEVDNLLFRESYNSFFQVNRNINVELFNKIKENIEESDTVLDMCCGVGTLSIVASKKAKRIYGIEIVENAIKDAIFNANLNKCDNVEFILGDAYREVSRFIGKVDTIIIDPPRTGLTKDALISILKIKPKKIVYVSCDPVTLARDLHVLNNDYDLNKSYILDMFPYTYHVETICILTYKAL